MTTTSRVVISAHALKAAADFVSKDRVKRTANVPPGDPCHTTRERNPEMTTTSRVVISAHALKAAADFVSKDRVKRTANVRVIAADGVAHVLATDSYRLYHYEEEVGGNAALDVLIPADDVKACKVTKSTVAARIDADERTIETHTPRSGNKVVRMGEPEGNDGHPFPGLERVEGLFPGDDRLGSGMVPSLNPDYAASAYKAFGALGMVPQSVHSGEMAPVTISAGWVGTGRSMVPSLNPDYAASAYKAFGALGMVPQSVHSGEMAPVTISAGWVGTGRRVSTGKPVPGAGTEYREARCRLRILVMPVRCEKWFCEATRLDNVVVRAAEPAPEPEAAPAVERVEPEAPEACDDGLKEAYALASATRLDNVVVRAAEPAPEPEAAPAVERVEPEAPEACDDGLKEAYALASADPDHVVIVRAFKDDPEPEAPECEPAPEPEPECEPEPEAAREYSQTCVRRDDCPERLAYVLWAMDSAGNIAYAVKRYRSAANAVTFGNAYASEYLMDSPTCWGVFKGTDIAA